MSDHTAEKGGSHDCEQAAWFDRSICPEPCGDMHYWCGECGRLLDHWSPALPPVSEGASRG